MSVLQLGSAGISSCPSPHRADVQLDIQFENYAGQALTTSHRAGNEAERERVIARGGDVPPCSSGECARVNGLIEVTRSLGDRWLKPVLDCTPEVVAHVVTPEDAFVVLGSDGLFDCVDDACVVRYSSLPYRLDLCFCPLA
jgi:serine/threonine protein phosphatase PrpC